MIYLDNAATTKPSANVVARALQYMTDDFGNASSIHSLGVKAKKAVEESRESIANLIGAQPEQIIFTSGGTEANNLAILGIQEYLSSIGRTHIITSIGEHDSVLKSVKKLEIKGQFHTSFLPLNSRGGMEIDNLVSEITPKTGLVSIMGINNEIGAENRIDLVAEECMKRGILFHTDCVQALGSVNIDVNRIGCDMMSLSSHKIHGLKGVGALYVKNPALIKPIIAGGASQEFGRRGGTENVAGIAAFGQACKDLSGELKEKNFKIANCKSIFMGELTKQLSNMGILNIFHDNGASSRNASKILNLRFDGVHAETLILLLSNMEVFVSAGSACHSHESVPSRVLTAIGLSPEEARSSIRVSFSGHEDDTSIRFAAEKIAKSVEILIYGT